MDNIINDLMKQYNIIGSSITIVKDYEIVLSNGYGFKKNKIPVLLETQFLAGSISKPIFALGVMLLHQKKKIDLNENINNYLNTEFDQFKNYNITLQQLLSHTAGTTIHGFGGYSDKKNIPTIYQILNGEKPSNSNKVYVNKTPGIFHCYSGEGQHSLN